MAKKKTSVRHRLIYGRKYYRARSMTRDPWFIERVAWLRKRFAETGCPVPEKGFRKYSDYLKWNEYFWNRLAEMERSAEYLSAREKITSGKERVTPAVLSKLEKFSQEFLPPVYGYVFDEILQHYDIDLNDPDSRDFLEAYVFFGQREYFAQPFAVSLKRNSKTDKFELCVQVFGHTKKEDFQRHWDWIADRQKYLHDFIGKNKAWEEFDRDSEIYAAAKALREASEKRRNKTWQAVDKQLYAELHEKYSELTIGNIRTIILRTAKRLGEV